MLAHRGGALRSGLRCSAAASRPSRSLATVLRSSRCFHRPRVVPQLGHDVSLQRRGIATKAANATFRAAWAVLQWKLKWASRFLHAVGRLTLRALANLFPALTKLLGAVPALFMRWAEPLPLNRQLLMIYSGCVVCMVLCAPILQFNLAAGALLGTQAGTVVLLAAVLTGSVINLLVARNMWYDWAREQFDRDERLKALEGPLRDHGVIVTTLIRLCPLFPAGIVSYIVGSTEVKIQDYIVGTVAGYTVPCGLVTYIGSGLAKVKVEQRLLSRIAWYGGISTSVISIAGTSLFGMWGLSQLKEQKALEAYRDPGYMDAEAIAIKQAFDRISSSPSHI
eukprot:Hpha_TRINITY_DN19322_c0_g1::TRINITY_DN19322_c0_g1_i1::g.81168::m.81168